MYTFVVSTAKNALFAVFGRISSNQAPERISTMFAEKRGQFLPC
jgi:hypothetical protein